MSKHNDIAIRHHEEEQRQIKKDVILSLVWNGLLLVLLFVLFFLNQSTGMIDNFFSRLFQF